MNILRVRFVTKDGTELGIIENLLAVPKVGEVIRLTVSTDSYFEPERRYNVVDVVWIIVTSAKWQSVDVVVA